MYYKGGPKGSVCAFGGGGECSEFKKIGDGPIKVAPSKMEKKKI
jgi:hypothetical protein